MKNLLLSLMVGSLALQANTFTINEKIKVIESTPVYKMISISTPYEECWKEQVQIDQSNTSNIIGKLIGGITGGIIGNQVGGGSGKTVATVGGAVVGTVVGGNLSTNNNKITKYETIKKCVTKYTSSTQEQFIGYNNLAYYKNQKIVKLTNNKLTEIQIQIYINY